MGVIVNHVIAAVIQPFFVSFVGLVIGLLLLALRRNRCGWMVTLCAMGWLYLCSTPLISVTLGRSLEQAYPPTPAEQMPKADAIVLLSGGMGGRTNVWSCGEMWSSADRVWHAARLWKAGKAPILLTTGVEEDDSTVNLLKDLGVDPDALVTERESLNTEENARFTAQALKERRPDLQRPKVLLVTSAWHMRRSVLMFRKYAPGLEVMPAGADYENSVFADEAEWYDLFRPTAGSLAYSAVILKEIVGYWGYRIRGW